MKKKLIYLTAFASLLSASAVMAGGPEMVIAAPSPFDGFYLGGSGSFHQTGFDIDGNLNLVGSNGVIFGPFNVPLATQNAGGTSTDAYFGIHGGWGKVFMNRWYAGVEGFADFGDANASSTTTVLPAFPLASASLSNSARVSTDYGVAAKLGILLSPTTLGYAKLGAEWADVKASISTQVGAGIVGPFLNSSNSNDEVGFLWGFGIEQFVWRDIVSVYAEYTYVDLGSTSTTSSFNFLGNDTENFFGLVAGNKVDTQISSFTGGLNVHFRRNWL